MGDKFKLNTRLTCARTSQYGFDDTEKTTKNDVRMYNVDVTV